jgi:hypothetical protein
VREKKMEYSPDYSSYQPRRKSVPEIIIENILISIIAVFLIVLGFLMLAMTTTTIDTQTVIQYKTFTNTYSIPNLISPQVIYTGNPLLTGLIVTQHNVGPDTWTVIPTFGYSYDGDTSALTVYAAPIWNVNFIRINASVDVTEVPYEDFFSILGIGLVIGAIATLFGIVGYNYYKNG